MLINSISTLSLLLLIFIAVITDIRSHRIPNWLTASILLAGLGTQIILSGSNGLIFSLSGIALGFICFFPFYLKQGMGAGDVKLMAAIGSFLGFKFTFLAAAYTLIFGGIIAVIIITRQGDVRNLLRRYSNMAGFLLSTRTLIYIPPAEGDPAHGRFAYALAIALGTYSALFQNGSIDNLTHLAGLV